MGNNLVQKTEVLIFSQRMSRFEILLGEDLSCGQDLPPVAV